MSGGIVPPGPFVVDVAPAVLDDLRDRLARTRLPADVANDDWGYGVNGRALGALVEHWHGAYDWRAAERRINEVPHYRTRIDGIPVHYVHARAKGPRPLPLVLTHGWPWTFWDFRDVIGPLSDPGAYGGDPADAFDVVVPSLPGFGFSTPLERPLAIWEVADVWARLMGDVLGYDRFGAHGGDLGGMVTAQLGHRYADRVAGIHLAPRAVRLDAYDLRRPWADLVAGTIPDGSSVDPALVAWEERKVAHATVQLLGPQTLAYGLHDSPAGLLAWLLERRRSWSDCAGEVEAAFSRDDLLTGATIYWATESFVSSARIYRDTWRRRWRPDHDRVPVVEAPTAVQLFTADLPPGASTAWIGEYFNLVRLSEVRPGGHFAAAERPDAVVADLRAFFRPLR